MGETNVSETDQERTTGGLAGKVAGKAKAAIGSVTGDDDMAREGRLQEAQSDAEIEARREAAEAEQREQEASLQEEQAEVEEERRRLKNEVAEEEREEKAERDRRQA